MEEPAAMDMEGEGIFCFHGVISDTSIRHNQSGQSFRNTFCILFTLILVDELLTSETGQILKLHDAYTTFLGMLKNKNLPTIKRSDFKAVVGPLIREQFDVALRNYVPFDGLSGVRGWKGVKMLQTAPG